MNHVKVLLVSALIATAALAAKASKPRVFLGYIYNAGAYTSVYIPYDCPENGYGCLYTTWNGYTYQVFQQVGNSFLPLKP
jgi:hypothetical protein